MDQALYSMLRVNLKNLVVSKLWICKDWHIQPSEIDKMVYYEYEQIIELINETNKEQEKQNKKEQEQYDSMRSSMGNMGNIGKMQNNIMNGMKLPKMSLPNFR